MKPKVSVIIPTYKRSDTLERAIESVLCQTYDPVEIVVVDDNGVGTPHQVENAKRLEKYFGNGFIYVAHDVNKNGSAARNTGAKCATGKWLAFLDDDDEFLPTKIEKQILRMQALSEEWGACYTGYFKQMANGKIQKSAETREGHRYVEALSRAYYIYGGSTLIVRREAFEAIGGYDESFRRNQDIEFVARLLKRFKMACVPERLINIHYDARVTTLTLNDLKEIDQHYLEKFKSQMDALSPQERSIIHQSIQLDQVGYLIRAGALKGAYLESKKHGLPMALILRYVFYLAHRLLTSRCYAFSI